MAHLLELGPDERVFGPHRLVRCAGEQGVHLVVHAPHLGDDDRFDQAEALAAAGGVQGHEGGEGQLVLPGVQGAGAVAQRLGQHGDDPIGKIDRRAALARLHVQGGVRLHVVGHVRDVHPQHPAIRRPLQRDGVVQILGVPAVDGEQRQGPQNPPAPPALWR